MKLNREQLGGIALVAILIVGSVVAVNAGLFMPQEAPPDAKSGDTYTPQEPEPTKTQDAPDRTQRAAAEGRTPDEPLHRVPDDHIRTTSSGVPSLKNQVRASAGSQTMNVETTTIRGEPALQLSDNRVHEGRWVSLPTNWFEESLGYQPERAYITHESGRTYASKIHTRNGQGVFYVRAFSTNTVTWSGTFTANLNKATNGSQIQYQITEYDATSDPVINLTGVDSTERDTVSAGGLANGGTLSLEVAGTSAATNAEVVFTGNSKGYAETQSGTGDTAVSIGGDEDPTGPSAGGEPEITFTGRESSTSTSASATGVDPSSYSTSISVGGNLEPTDGSEGNPTLQVTAHGSSSSYNPALDSGDGDAEGSEILVGDRSFDDKRHGAIEIVPNADGEITQIDVPVSGTSGADYGVTVDVYIVQGEAENQLGTGAAGTKVKDNWNPSWSTGTQSIPLDSAYAVSSGTTYTVQFISSGTDSDGTSDYLRVATDGSPGTTRYMRSEGDSWTQTRSEWGDIDLTIQQKVSGLSASLDSGDSVSFGDFADGETKTRTIDLKTATSSLSFSDSGQGTIDYTLSWTERTGTENPSVDVTGDGNPDVSYTGVLASGQTATVELAALSTSTSSVDTSTVAGPQPDWSLDYNRVEHTENPGIDVNGDGTDDASYSGVLAPGATATKSLPDLTLSDDTGTVSTSSAPVDVSVSYTEHTNTQSGSVEVNDGSVSFSALSPGSTVSKTGNQSWLQEGTNYVNITQDTSGLSTDAPIPQVAVNYSHDIEDKVSVEYSAEKWTERYNISKTYSSSRTNASVTIPFEGNVIGIRNVETSVNDGSWTSVDPANYSLSGTTLTVDLGSVAKNDKVEVRATGQKVAVTNGQIAVLEPTTIGNDLNSKIQVDSVSGGDLILGLEGTPEGQSIHYTVNESYSNADEYATIDASGNNDLILPNAAAGSTFRVRTLPVTVSPTAGDVSLEVENASTSEPEFVVSPGPGGNGHEVEYTFVAAKDGTKYILWSRTNEVVRDSGTASSPLTLVDDDSSETLAILIDADGTTSAGGSSGGGGGVIPTMSGSSQPDLQLLLVVALAIAGLVVVSRNDEQVTKAGQNAANSIESTLDDLPVFGPTLGRAIAGITRSSAQLARAVLGNRTIALALAGAVGLYGVQAGAIVLPAGSNVILVVAGIGVLALVGLREYGEFTMQRYAGIMLATSVVALQVLRSEPILTAIVNSRIFPVIAIAAVILGYKALEAWRASRQPRPIIVETDGGGDQ